MKALRTLLAITSVLVSFTAVANDDVVDVDFAQPPITTQVVPENPHDWNLSRHLKSQALRPFEPNVPSYLGKGNLISSWNPHPTNVKGHPTFIIIHGGHGISPNNIDTAVWAIRTFDANVMILDSFWTRGKEENWKTWTRYGANMRMLDV